MIFRQNIRKILQVVIVALFNVGLIWPNWNLLFHQSPTRLSHFGLIKSLITQVNLCHLLIAGFYNHLRRVSHTTKPNLFYNYFLILQKDNPSTAGVKIKQQPIQYRKMSTTALYIGNMPFLSIQNVKTILAGDPLRIQLQHIYNLSWIDKQILELLVDSNHADRIKNRIGKHSDYYVKSDFDPLSPASFNWEGKISPEPKMALLKRNFAMRLAASIGSTKLESTRQSIMAWATHRGIGQQLQHQLQKAEIVLPFNKRNPTDLPVSNDSPIARPSANPPFTMTTITPGPSKYLKRKFSISSNESMQR